MYLKHWIAAAAIAISTGSYAQNAKLALNKGQKFEVTTVSKMSSIAEVMGQQMETNVDNNSTEMFEAKDRRTGETDFGITLTKLKVNIQSMGQDMSFDSDKKDNSGPFAESMSKSVGKTRNTTVDDNGKVLKEDKVETETGNMMLNMGNASVSTISLFYASLLGKELKPEAVFPDSLNSNAEKMKSKIVGNFVVKSIDNGIASIEFTGTQTNSGTIEQMGQEMGMSGTNKVTTQIKMNIATGIIMETSTTVDGNSTVEFSGMSIPVTIKSTTTTTTKAL
ncbi:MAG: hypothetical protein JNM68_10580 [Dinghuibacter sp.]|nr:hypothetical protein [Dinghuibacter sp.]